MANRQKISCAALGASLLLVAACGHSTNFIEEDTQDRPLLLNQNVGSGNNNGAEPSSRIVSFVTFGDWGSGRDEQVEVAEAIGDYCTANPCDFVVTLGDNFYSNGVEGIEDPLWQERFHDVYDFLGLVFYASLGNHDNEGSIQAQIGYTDEVDNWVMPDEHYTFSKPDAVRPPLVAFFVINSDWPNFDEAAQAWLDGAVADSNATWKFLAMHHPLYSNGNHGDGDDSYREALIPIICERIDLVLSGHDHSFSHLRSDQDGCLIEQLVIGTAGAELQRVDAADPRVLATGSFHGFGWVRISAEAILFRMIDTWGDVFYEVEGVKY